jgi:hypothetical protein
MTTTFDPSLADDVSYVRFYIGDTKTDEGVYLQDETIQFFLDETESYEETIIECIKYIITQLSTPNFSKDWLTVDVSKAREAYEKLLTEKRNEYGMNVAIASVSISNPHRADSYEQDENGEYEDVTGDP